MFMMEARYIKTAIWGVVVFTAPFLAYAFNILNTFYDVGSSFYDAGWSAYLIHDADLQLHNPPCVDEGISWLNFHISPLFWVTSAIGHLIPLTRIQFYAAFVGISHALPAIAIFWLLVSGYRMTGAGQRIIAALLGLFFAFNGLAMAIARFPHFVMFMVGAGMIFIVALILKRFGIAVIFFILCLSTREDAGFHLFALLSLLSVWGWREGKPWREQKPAVIFGILGLLYSTAATALQHTFSGDHSLLVSEYLGHPMFGGATLLSIGTRFLGWMQYRGYVVLPAVCALAWAIARRNPLIVLGYAAFIPWGILHLVAARDMLGTLPSYYAFPYMFASSWPLVGLLLQRRQSAEDRPSWEAIYGFALLTAASLVSSHYQHNPTRIDLPADFFSWPSPSGEAATERALRGLAGASQLGVTFVDQSILALGPDLYCARAALSEGPHGNPDSIVYFAKGFEHALAEEVAVAAGLERVYEASGTQIRVATNHLIEGSQGLALLRPVK
jgi:hypothetical protein